MKKCKINLNKIRTNKGGKKSSLYLRYQQAKYKNMNKSFNSVSLNDKIDTLILIKSNEVLKNFKKR